MGVRMVEACGGDVMMRRINNPQAQRDAEAPEQREEEMRLVWGAHAKPRNRSAHPAGPIEAR